MNCFKPSWGCTSTLQSTGGVPRASCPALGIAPGCPSDGLRLREQDHSGLYREKYGRVSDLSHLLVSSCGEGEVTSATNYFLKNCWPERHFWGFMTSPGQAGLTVYPLQSIEQSPFCHIIFYLDSMYLCFLLILSWSAIANYLEWCEILAEVCEFIRSQSRLPRHA